MKLAELTWPEVERLDRDLIVVVPLAALEQHAHHLPLFTDSILCGAVVEALEDVLPKDVLLLPVQWLGASAHHLGMPGTLSAELDTHGKLIHEPIQCLLPHGFRRFFVVNGHGGNVDTFHLALRHLACGFPNALFAGACYWDVAEGEIASILEGARKSVGHACEFETSMMLHIRPDLVRNDQISDDSFIHPPPQGAYLPLDLKRQTRRGAIGFPTLASAEKGKQFLDVVVRKLVEMVQALRARPLPARD